MTVDDSKLLTPDYLLAGINFVQRHYHFAKVTRDTYRQSSFLDHRIKPRPTEVVSASHEQISAVLENSHTPPAAYVLHTAFCCSTLLASCLDHEPATLVLKEPLVFSHLADWRRQISQAGLSVSADQQPVIDTVLAIMDRRYDDSNVLVKPSNFANALLPDLISRKHPVVLMSSGLKGFLVSILKKRQEAEDQLDHFVNGLLRDSDYLSRVEDYLPGTGIEGLDLLQKSVVMWHCQRYQFQRYHEQSVMQVSMEGFLKQPLETLSSINQSLALGIEEQFLEDTVSSGAFRRHSKASDNRYSPKQQKAEAQALEQRYGEELKQALTWAEDLLDKLPVSPFPGD